jgi:hypothetical protein
MECPKCKHQIDDPLEECYHKILDSGSYPDFMYGGNIHHFYAELTCPVCGEVFDYSDSS